MTDSVNGPPHVWCWRRRLGELRDDLREMNDKPRGCLFALSQPPLMLFLGFIGGLLFFTAVHDLYRW